MSLRNLPEVKAFTPPRGVSFEPSEHEVEAFDESVRAAIDAENVISIYGAIGVDPWTDIDNSERRISAALRAIGRKPITVNLNSPGGNFFAGLAIYNLLRQHPERVDVNVIALAGSAASIIAMAGDEVRMSEGSMLMVHDASGIVIGNRHDMADTIEILTEVDNAMADIYAARSGKDRAAALAWMDKRAGDGTTFNVQSAIDNGLADKKLARDAVKVDADASHQIPAVRVIDRALAASGMPRSERRSLLASMKGGMHDAAAIVPVTLDADTVAGLRRLTETMRAG